jgi:hypothetical protein
MNTFFVLSLPRSRTAWMANFLTYDCSYCFHEGWLQVPSMHGLRELFASTGKPVVGNADCGNIFFVDEILDTFTEPKFVMIERPIADVLASLRSMGPEFGDEEGVWRGHELLQAFKRQNVPMLAIDYDSLSQSAYRLIWDYCVGSAYDHQRTVMLDGLNVQIMPDKKLQQIRDVNDQNWLMEALN